MKELLLFLGRIVWIFVMVSGWVLLFGLGWMYFTYVKPHYDEARDMRQAFEQAVSGIMAVGGQKRGEAGKHFFYCLMKHGLVRVALFDLSE